jgi:hypothetical protein
LQEALRRQRGHFNLIAHDSGFKADIYLANADALHRQALQHRRAIVVEGERVWIAPPEYVIVRKLEFYREGQSDKHLRDIGAMLQVSGELVDRERLAAWIAQLGLAAEWALCQSTSE